MHIDKYKAPYGDTGYLDEEGCHYPDAESWLGTKIMGFCGCGNLEAALKYVRDVLMLIDNIYKPYDKADAPFSYNKPAYKALDEYFGNNQGLQMTIYYILDDKGLTEHGGCVPGWLTKAGVEFMQDVSELYKEG